MSRPVNALSGTWELDVAQSTFVPGPPPQQVTYTIQATEEQLHMTTDRVDQLGNQVHYQYSAKIDGREYPVSAPHADTVSWTRYGKNQYKTEIKKDGHLLMWGDLVMSDDEMSLTASYEGKTADGQRITNQLLVRRRQQ